MNTSERMVESMSSVSWVNSLTTESTRLERSPGANFLKKVAGIIRRRVISGGFYSVVSPADKERAIAGDDAAQACWFPVNELPTLAFDHAEVFRKALVHLRIGFHLIPVAFLLLGDIFTIPDIQRLYTDVFCRTFDRRNFQKRFLKLGLVDPVDEPERSKRLPKRYRFNEEAYYQLRKKVMKF